MRRLYFSVPGTVPFILRSFFTFHAATTAFCSVPFVGRPCLHITLWLRRSSPAHSWVAHFYIARCDSRVPLRPFIGPYWAPLSFTPSSANFCMSLWRNKRCSYFDLLVKCEKCKRIHFWSWILQFYWIDHGLRLFCPFSRTLFSHNFAVFEVAKWPVVSLCSYFGGKGPCAIWTKIPHRLCRWRQLFFSAKCFLGNVFDYNHTKIWCRFHWIQCLCKLILKM